MLKTILHQMWNQRRQNGWIFLELLVVSFFLWFVIDPIYVLTANRAIDKGYNPDGLYVITIGSYDEAHGNYNPDMATDSLNLAAYERIIRTIRSQPEIASWFVATSWSFPNTNSWAGTRLYADTTSVDSKKEFVSAQQYNFFTVEGSNIFQTYGIKDARTGADIQIPPQPEGKVFLSERLAVLLFGTNQVIGKKVYSNGESQEIAGVFNDFKHRDYEQPYPLVISTFGKMEGREQMIRVYNLVVRVKPSVDAAGFKRRFEQEVGPQLSAGNLYFDNLKDFATLSNLYAMKSGVANKLRLQYALTGFAILCTFLGMVGTFWIRCNARREEIGIMRSLGATQNNIVRQFLLESGLLVTVAFVIVVPFLLYLAYTNGMYTPETKENFIPNPAYGQNCFGIHFLTVLALSYLILLLVSLVGTCIPVKRAAKIQPMEALRDE